MRKGLPAAIAAALETRGHRWSRAIELAGDVSRRAYFRLVREQGREPERSLVLAVYPDELRGACRRFGVTAGWLAEARVRGPAVVDSDCEAGWMLVEDLGPETLYDRFRERPDPWPQLRPWVLAAARIAGRIAELPPAPVAALNPPLDRALLLRELEMTWNAYLEPAGLSRRDGLGRGLEEALSGLCEALCEESGEILDAGPLVPCHRDFMVRNLVPVLELPEEASLGVLDHQDLCLGPRFYDLASLLNDSLFAPAEVEEAVLEERGATSAGDRLAYRRAAVQRTLKAVGTFARHGGHRRLIRPTLERALEHLAELPEGAGVAHELRDRWRAGEGPAIC